MARRAPKRWKRDVEKTGDHIHDPRVLVLKGMLFLGAAIASAGLILLGSPTAETLFLVTVLAFCSARFYYFMFHVIENWVDHRYRFAGLGSAIRFLWNRPRMVDQTRPRAS